MPQKFSISFRFTWIMNALLVIYLCKSVYSWNMLPFGHSDFGGLQTNKQKQRKLYVYLVSAFGSKNKSLKLHRWQYVRQMYSMIRFHHGIFEFNLQRNYHAFQSSCGWCGRRRCSRRRRWCRRRRRWRRRGVSWRRVHIVIYYRCGRTTTVTMHNWRRSTWRFFIFRFGGCGRIAVIIFWTERSFLEHHRKATWRWMLLSSVYSSPTSEYC